MSDEKMVGRGQVRSPEKRPPAHMVEIERRTYRVPDDPSAQPVDDMTPLLEMRKEREREAKKPNVDTGHAGHHWKVLHGTWGRSH